MASTPVAFANAGALRAWLRRHHKREAEIVLRLAKNHVAHAGVTYAEALDEALCFGWIDGIRRRFDADTFTVRFTPRRPKSNWSRVNVAHVRRLIEAKRMTSAGMAAFTSRDQRGSHERAAVPFSASDERRIRSNRTAWSYFAGEAPSYRRACMAWVVNAKRNETRKRRLGVLIDCSARGVRIPGYPSR